MCRPLKFLLDEEKNKINKTIILILWKQEFDSKQRNLSITIVGMDAEGGSSYPHPS